MTGQKYRVTDWYILRTDNYFACTEHEIRSKSGRDRLAAKFHFKPPLDNPNVRYTTNWKRRERNSFPNKEPRTYRVWTTVFSSGQHVCPRVRIIRNFDRGARVSSTHYSTHPVFFSVVFLRGKNYARAFILSRRRSGNARRFDYEPLTVFPFGHVFRPSIAKRKTTIRHVGTTSWEAVGGWLYAFVRYVHT